MSIVVYRHRRCQVVANEKGMLTLKAKCKLFVAMATEVLIVK